jgi:hypothetical protein
MSNGASAEVKVSIDAQGAQAGAQTVENALNKITNADKKAREQLSKPVKSEGLDKRFNARMIGDLINIGTASNGAAMRVSALTHALKIPALAAGGFVAVASAIYEIAKAATEGEKRILALQTAFSRGNKGGNGSAQSLGLLAGRYSSNKEGIDQIRERYGDVEGRVGFWKHLDNFVQNPTGFRSEERAAKAEIDRRKKELEFGGASAATKFEDQTDVAKLGTTNRYASSTLQREMARKEEIQTSAMTFNGPEAERINEAINARYALQDKEAERAQNIESASLYSEQKRASLRSSNDKEHAQALQIELAAAKRILELTTETVDKQKASVRVSLAEKAIRENDLALGDAGISRGLSVNQSRISSEAAQRLTNSWGDNATRIQSQAKVDAAQEALTAAQDRNELDDNQSTRAAKMQAQNELNTAKAEQLRLENEIAIRNKEQLANLKESAQETALNAVGARRESQVMAIRHQTEVAAARAEREGRPDEAAQIRANGRLSESASGFQAWVAHGGMRRPGSARAAIRAEQREQRRQARAFERFQHNQGGQFDYLKVPEGGGAPHQEAGPKDIVAAIKELTAVWTK